MLETRNKKPNNFDLDTQASSPEVAKAMYLYLVEVGRIPPEKQLAPDQVDEFFGVKQK